MKPAPFRYHRPQSVDEALHLLETPGARVLAGGQSLLPRMNLRLESPGHLVDIGWIPELCGIHEDDGALVIGAMSRQRDIERSPLVRRRLPLAAAALAHVGHQQTRNWGTLGGSLCQLLPGAELPAVALAYDATLEVRSLTGIRRVAMRDFALQALAPELAADELVASIRLQSWPEGHGCGFHEVARRHGHAAIAAGMALVTLDGGGRIDRISLTVTGSTPIPTRLCSTERHLAGRKADAEAIATAAAAAAELPARDDPLVASWYRQRMAGVAVRRAFAAAVSQAMTLP